MIMKAYQNDIFFFATMNTHIKSFIEEFQSKSLLFTNFVII